MPTPKSGYIYLIGSERFSWFKIGMSIIPDVRVRDIGILLPFKIKLVAMWFAEDRCKAESAMHRKYSARAINGEWFHFKRKELQHVIDAEPPFFGMRMEVGQEKFSNMIADVRSQDFRPYDLEFARLRKETFDCAVREYMRNHGLNESGQSLKMAKRAVSKNMRAEKRVARATICASDHGPQ